MHERAVPCRTGIYRSTCFMTQRWEHLVLSKFHDTGMGTSHRGIDVHVLSSMPSEMISVSSRVQLDLSDVTIQRAVLCRTGCFSLHRLWITDSRQLHTAFMPWGHVPGKFHMQHLRQVLNMQYVLEATLWYETPLQELSVASAFKNRHGSDEVN